MLRSMSIFIRKSLTAGVLEMEQTDQYIEYSNHMGLFLNPKVIDAHEGVALWRSGGPLTPLSITSSFHKILRGEIFEGNPFLSIEDQSRLRHHYPLLLAPDRYPPELVERIYVNRRAPAVQVILEDKDPMVFDAGCGFGSESFLFASMGARILAVDISEEQIQVAKKRQRYFEETLGRPLDVTFSVADLDEYTGDTRNLSLTWLASVLAAVRDQGTFLAKVYEATRPGGQVMITDMNLFNPLFLIREWYRRQQAKKENVEFSLHSNFWDMVKRRNRIGAHYFRGNDGSSFDDVQFFSVDTLSKLLSNVGFTLTPELFSGFVPPHMWQLGLESLENAFSRFPILRRFGYFYLVAGTK